MKKRTRLSCSMLLVCVVMIAVLEASRRSWEVHSRLSVVAHGHVFYRVVHVTEMSGRIPEHYPIHTLESQLLVYSGDKYLGYLSKHSAALGYRRKMICYCFRHKLTCPG
jgi:hypothetical protein